ncbi:MAG TPA: carboxypeptidase-like regulatory domain-containing protein [Saprospiraceae bacterium]|nr:carboxypeptidase-like regulatory domain-containing protein [Saprospiraceae bacterium]
MDQELTYKWIQERLRELHSGTLSERDRLRLVEIAKEDPFVSDALEGFHAHPDEAHAEHLEAIAAKIKQTKRERRRWLMPNLTVTAIAASILLIVATYAVITRMEKSADETLFVFVEPDSLARHDSLAGGMAMETTTPAAEEAIRKMDGKETATPSTVKDQSVSSQTESKHAKVQPAPGVDAMAKTETPITESAPPSAQTSALPAAKESAKTVYTDDELKAADEDIADQSQTETARAQRDEGYYANQMNPALMQSRVIGHVTDAQSGAPIMSAKLAVDYSNQLFYTNIEGGFELHIPQPEALLQVTYPGYADTSLVIRPSEENLVVEMKPGNILSSNVTAGAKTKGPVPSGTLNPVTSFHTFYNYIAAASSLQLTSEASSARRKVTIEFTVRKDGRPKDIRVKESSRDKTYDDEAKRLLESGPDWVCLGGEYPCTRSYTFYFR